MQKSVIKEGMRLICTLTPFVRQNKKTHAKIEFLGRYIEMCASSRIGRCINIMANADPDASRGRSSGERQEEF